MQNQHNQPTCGITGQSADFMATTSFKFDAKTNKLLEDLRQHYGASSKAEVLRKAIALLDVAADAEDHGHQIMVESKDGKERRQVLIR